MNASKFKISAFLVGLLLISVLVTACAGDVSEPAKATATTEEVIAEPAEEEAEEETPSPVVIQVTDVGALGDKGFNDGVHEGLKKAAEELGLEVLVLQSRSDTDYVANLTQAAEQNPLVVMAVGFLQTDALYQVAQEYPDVMFGGVDVAFSDKDGNPVHLDNVREILFREEQASYLLGVLAGHMTQETTSDKLNPENIIGCVAGIKFPSVDRWITGYIAGAKSVNPDVEVLLTYSGTFSDTAVAKEAALAQYEQGADMIFEIGGGAGLGVFEAAQEVNHFAFTTDLDKNHLAPDHILASALKDVTQATYLTVKDVVNGEFTSGVVKYDIQNGGVGLSEFHGLDPLVPQNVKDDIAAAKQAMTNEEIVPPVKLEDIPGFEME